MIYLFKHYTTMMGSIEIDAKDEKEAIDKFNKSKTSDLKWRSDPSGKYRTTYEVICKDTIKPIE